MQGGIEFLDWIILIAMAVFIFTRFTGDKLPKDKKVSQKVEIVKFSDKSPTKETKAVREAKKIRDIQELGGLDQITAADKYFNEKEFIQGAQGAYEMYFEALNRADEEGLDVILAPRMFDRLMDEIDMLEDQGQYRTVEVQSIEHTDIVDARLHGRTSIIDVKYTAHQSDFIKDTKDELVKGDDQDFKKVMSVWTWARSIDSEDLNWELEEIKLVS